MFERSLWLCACYQRTGNVTPLLLCLCLHAHKNCDGLTLRFASTLSPSAMGFFGCVTGYVSAKATIAVFSLTMFATAGVTSIASPFCPVLIPIAAASWNLAGASGAMLVSPIDPVTTAVMATTTVVSGPL